MKKLYGIVLFCLILCAACTSDSDGLTDRVDQLEKDVNGIKSKTVIELKKQGDQLVIVYSNGTTESIPFPEGIPGATGATGETGPAGAPGKDGIGIKTLTYDQNSGILTITLTNEEVSQFKIIDNGTDWKAVLIGDTNGRMFVTEALLGAVPVIKASYNADYQLATLESNLVREMEVRKSWDVTRNYTNGVLDNYVTKKYAVEDRTKIAYTLGGDWGGPAFEQVSFPVYKNFEFREANSDGTYNYYRYETQQGTQHIYRKYKAIYRPDYSWGYEIIQKKSANEYYVYQYFTSTGSEYIYALKDIFVVEGKVAAGDVESSRVVDVETDAQGRITRQYDAVNTGGQPTGYQAFEYNSSGQVKTTKNYVKDSQGQWVANGTYETFNYDANNRLTSTVRTYADGTSGEVQKAVYDKNGNPMEIWTWTPAQREYIHGPDPVTGEWGYLKTIRPAGFNKVAMLEYDYTYKNFLGNTITALVPQLEGYKIVNAPKRITSSNSYSFGKIEYKDFNEFGYPGTVVMDASEGISEDDFDDLLHLHLKLNYTVKK